MTEPFEFKNNLIKLKCYLLGDIGFGECYVDGSLAIDPCRNLADIIQEFEAKQPKRIIPYFKQSLDKAKQHYDIPAEFYQILLGESMSYTCAKFDNKYDTLEMAQNQKYELHRTWLRLNSGIRLLDCGFGWGGFLDYVAKNSNARFIGITISEKQYRHAFKRKYSNTQLIISSWRDHLASERYNRFTSQGMLEHVGKKNIPDYFRWVDLITTPDVIGTLQFISRDKPISPWADKYIFPGAYPPNFNEVSRAMKQAGLTITDVRERGNDYVKTLEAWLFNLTENIRYVYELGFDDKFVRMFKLYLSGGIASFKEGDSQLIQLRFVKGLK